MQVLFKTTSASCCQCITLHIYIYTYIPIYIYIHTHTHTHMHACMLPMQHSRWCTRHCYQCFHSRQHLRHAVCCSRSIYTHTHTHTHTHTSLAGSQDNLIVPALADLLARAAGNVNFKHFPRLYAEPRHQLQNLTTWRMRCAKYMRVYVCVRERVCVHLGMYVCMLVCMYASMYVCVHMYVCACMYVCMHACMYACMHVCMHACMYICMHTCMHVCIYACVHACMHAY